MRFIHLPVTHLSLSRLQLPFSSIIFTLALLYLILFSIQDREREGGGVRIYSFIFLIIFVYDVSQAFSYIYRFCIQDVDFELKQHLVRKESNLAVPHLADGNIIEKNTLTDKKRLSTRLIRKLTN